MSFTPTGFDRFLSTDEVPLFVTTDRGTAVVVGTTGDPEVATSLVIDTRQHEVRQVAEVRTVRP